MNFFSLIQNKSKLFYFYLALFGLVNATWASALLLMINSKITGVKLPYFNEYDWLIYGILIVVSFIGSIAFQSYMITITYNLGNELGLSIFDKLRFTSYENFIKLGEEKVRTAMEDVKVVQSFPGYFIGLVTNGLMVTVGLVYLFWIDLAGGTLVMVSMIVLAAFYIKRNGKIEIGLKKARALNDVYQQNVNDFLRGFREVKMNAKRNDGLFIDFITVNRNKANSFMVRSIVKLTENATLGAYLWYMMIGVILFVLPSVFSMEAAVKTSFLVTLLYLMGPTNEVVGLIEDYFLMKVSLGRLNEFNNVVNANTAIERGHGSEVISENPFEILRFENVTYEYQNEFNAVSFRLKPLNLEIKRGETIFVTGGNGSGKSTFITLLTGLYRPKSGNILLNGKPVTDENLTSYRNYISSIFTDVHLFSENYDNLPISKTNEEFIHLLEKMQLTDRVTFDDENNKILHTLSKGQQKRMALIYSLLEKKDIFIFDEWAAEQDPVFRKYFYTVIVPELKEMGKTVIAVTHDDAYFDCASRIIKFNYGRIEEDTKSELVLQPNGLYRKIG